MSYSTPYQRPLVCTYWNIQGYKSKIIGNKLNEILAGSDIVELAEIHADKEVPIPGFKSLKQKIREKKSK